MSSSVHPLLIAVVLQMIASAAFATGKTWYVTAEDGLPGGDGTSWSSPWRGFDNIGTNILPGDTLYIDGGQDQMTYSHGLTMNDSGANGAPITLRIDVADSAHNGLVIIDVADAAEYAIDMNCSYVTIDGYNPDAPGGRKHGISVVGASSAVSAVIIRGAHNSLRYVDESSASIGILLWGGVTPDGYNSVEYCRVHGNNAGEETGIQIKGSNENTIHGCAIFGNRGFGVNTYGIGVDLAKNNPGRWPDGLHIQYCSIYDNGVPGDDQRHGVYIGGNSRHCYVLSCNIYNNSGFGVHLNQNAYPPDLTGPNKGQYAENNVVMYNDVFANGVGGIIASGYQLQTVIRYNNCYFNKYFGISTRDASSGYIMNNILSSNGHSRSADGADGDYKGGGFGWTIDYNTYYESSQSEVLIRWGTSLYHASPADFAAFQAVGEDGHSTVSLVPGLE